MPRQKKPWYVGQWKRDGEVECSGVKYSIFRKGKRYIAYAYDTVWFDHPHIKYSTEIDKTTVDTMADSPQEAVYLEIARSVRHEMNLQ